MIGIGGRFGAAPHIDLQTSRAGQQRRGGQRERLGQRRGQLHPKPMITLGHLRRVDMVFFQPEGGRVPIG